MKTYDPSGVNFQGFIILEDCYHPWEESQLDAYFSKFIGTTLRLHCMPQESEIIKAIVELLPICWRVVLITRFYRIDNKLNGLIRRVKTCFPRMEHVRMPFPR